MKPKVYIPEYIDVSGLDLLRSECECIAPWEDGAPMMDISGEDHPLRRMLYEADAVIVRVFTISAKDLDRPNRLKIIVKHGVGLDNIDIDAATARRIPVAYTPTGNANAVAEHTLALMLALSRRIEPASRALRAGRFAERNDFAGVELSGKTLGIIGLGRIGRLVALKAAGLGMDVIAYDPYVSSHMYAGPARLLNSIEELLGLSDYATLHLPLTPETRHIIDAKRISCMKPGARLINTSRGAVLDEKALVGALAHGGRLAGAAFDVFEQEPLPADHPLCGMPNVVLTPHIAGLTDTSLERTAVLAAQAVIDILQGRTPADVVNPEVLAV